MLALSLLALAVTLPAATPVEIDRAVDGVLASEGYQTTLPAERGIWIPTHCPPGSNCSGSQTVFGGSPPSSPKDLEPNKRPPLGDDDADKEIDTDKWPHSSRDDGARTPDGQLRERDEQGRVRWRESEPAAPPPLNNASQAGGGDVVLWLLWLLGGAIAFLLAGGIIFLIIQRAQRKPDDVIDTVVVLDPKARKPPIMVVVAPPELTLVEQLAARGEYAAATRELLRLAFAAASEQLGTRLPPESTSRELLVGLPLHPGQRDVLQRIVTAVELGHFGKRVLSRETFEHCRSAFSVFEAGFDLQPQAAA